jgi:hypothetical protein
MLFLLSSDCGLGKLIDTHKVLKASVQIIMKNDQKQQVCKISKPLINGKTICIVFVFKRFIVPSSMHIQHYYLKNILKMSPQRLKKLDI